MRITKDDFRKVLVLGLGTSGTAAAELALARGFEVVAVDEARDPNIDGLPGDVAVFAGWSEGEELPDCDLIVVSPGVAPFSPLGRAAAAARAPVVGELEFASAFLEAPMLAVTGTNGKTTTVEMTEFILGGNAVAAGNIGKPLSAVALEERRGVVVVEASSFQLESVSDSFAPLSAALLNVASDHIDRHGDLEAYVAAKFAVFNHIADSSDCVVKSSLLDCWNANSVVQGAPTTFSASEKTADAFLDGSTVVFKNLDISPVDLSESRVNGAHNAENFMAAVLLASKAASPDALVEGVERLIRDFRVDAHRQEIVAEFDGVRCVNDSKATNPHALFAALEVFGADANVLLIAGGLDKNMDFAMSERHARSVRRAFLIGEAAAKIEEAWRCCPFECERCCSLESAAESALRAATAGDVVLLAPGCASMDMFANYKERGEIFRKIILQTRS